MPAGRTTSGSPIRKGSPIRPARCCTRTQDSRGTSQWGRKLARRKKKPPRGELTAAEKRTNRKLARIRVKVEHALAGVKRSRIVKDVLRNTKEGMSDAVMEASCGLHNVRDENRKRRLKT